MASRPRSDALSCPDAAHFSHLMQAIVRLSGGWIGRVLAKRMVRARYSGEAARTLARIANYVYHLWAAPGGACSEAAAARLLELGARWGRRVPRPLEYAWALWVRRGLRRGRLGTEAPPPSAKRAQSADAGAGEQP